MFTYLFIAYMIYVYVCVCVHVCMQVCMPGFGTSCLLPKGLLLNLELGGQLDRSRDPLVSAPVTLPLKAGTWLPQVFTWALGI